MRMMADSSTTCELTEFERRRAARERDNLVARHLPLADRARVHELALFLSCDLEAVVAGLEDAAAEIAVPPLGGHRAGQVPLARLVG
jgi:hypothetical protein